MISECEVRFTPCDRKDDRECGIFCYDPKTETCTTGGFVCAIGEIVCTDVCYNPLTQNCYTNKIDEGVVCDKVSERFCGEKCIGATENCVDVWTLALSDLRV